MLFRDSLSLSLSLLHLHVFCMSGSVAFSILKMKRGQRAVGSAPALAALLLRKRRGVAFFFFALNPSPASRDLGGGSEVIYGRASNTEYRDSRSLYQSR